MNICLINSYTPACIGSTRDDDNDDDDDMKDFKLSSKNDLCHCNCLPKRLKVAYMDAVKKVFTPDILPHPNVAYYYNILLKQQLFQHKQALENRLRYRRR